MTDWSHLTALEKLDALRWRCIGPARGGRVVAVAGDPVDPMVFYFGACAGRIWKAIDGGGSDCVPSPDHRLVDFPLV